MGPLPLQFGHLLRVETFGLSNNAFTGEVPTSLAQLQDLNLLVLSDNLLSGTLPQFAHYATVDITGNKDMLERNGRAFGIFDAFDYVFDFCWWFHCFVFTGQPLSGSAVLSANYPDSKQQCSA